MNITKQLRPPSNWQDFEKLCKKLFGEVWKCSDTIKLNGRLGQSQAGVDVYGKPKGENSYNGVQCKGKNNYEDKTITTKEIDNEIEKAKIFKPKLNKYILATTAKKDSKIEEYIRLKDIESVENGDFEIIIYFWEDLVDLIEEHRETYRYYIDSINYKDEYDINITIKGEENKSYTALFIKKTITYEEKELQIYNNQLSPISAMIYNNSLRNFDPFKSQDINRSRVFVDIKIKNNGNKVIEDWNLKLIFPTNANKICDDFISNICNYKDVLPYRKTWADDDDKYILYKPLNNSPLIQKDEESFYFSFIPTYKIKEYIIEWKLLSRDFDKEGKLLINIDYEFKEETIIKQVDNPNEYEDEIIVEEYIEKNQDY